MVIVVVVAAAAAAAEIMTLSYLHHVAN